jgi:putative ABC transport system permease protein
MGGELRIREEVRAAGWEHAVETIVGDVRYAARRLRRDPGYSAAAILILGLGIGATTAIFSTVHPILIEPLPYPDPDRLAAVWEIGADDARVDGTFGMYRELAERSIAFEHLSAFRPWQPTLTGASSPERLNGQRVSASWFAVLGVSPSLGRALIATEDEPGATGVVVLSNGLWQRRFGGDPDIVGRVIALDGEQHTVVGIMPEAFENVLAPEAELWAPLQYGMEQGRAWGHHLRLVGRLRRGVDPADALRDVGAIGRSVILLHRPATYGSDVRFAIVPLHEQVTSGVRSILLATFGAVALLLLIACANVANLQLARGVTRRAEFALRRALGAPQARLVRHVLIESVVLTFAGAVLGIVLSVIGVRWLVSLAPANLPRLAAIGVDGTALVFCLLMATVTGIGLGIAPAMRAARGDMSRRLKTGSLRVVRGPGTRGALAIGEIALALVLLTSAGLLLRSVQRLLSVNPGFDAAALLTMQIPTSGRQFDSDEAERAAADRILAAVRAVPGVQSVAITSHLPLAGDEESYGLRFDPPINYDPGERGGTVRYAVSPEYFGTMRITLIRGRLLESRDDSRAPPVALISESLARRRLPGQDPIGKRVSIGPPEPLYTIVGIVADVRHMSLALDPAEAVYTTPEQWRFADEGKSLVIRARGSPAALAPAARQAIWAVEPAQPVARVEAMEDLVARSSAARRFALVLFQTFGLTALVLAGLGLYGVLAGRVAERTREIGVRAALGATRAGLVFGVVRQGMALAAAGIAIGLASAFAAMRAIESLLFGVASTDFATYMAVTVILGAVALLACAIPAWRAARVDPVRALRLE